MNDRMISWYFISALTILKAIGVLALPPPCVFTHVVDGPCRTPAEQTVCERDVGIIGGYVTHAPRHFAVGYSASAGRFERRYHLEDREAGAGSWGIIMRHYI